MKIPFFLICLFLILLPFYLFSSDLTIQYRDGSYGNVTGNSISVTFESYDMPGWYIGVEEEDAFLFTIGVPIENEYTTFNVVPGIADRNAVSIQIAIDTNFYLSGQNKIIELDEYSTWDLYKQNTTFIIEPGLADIDNPNLVSLRSWKYPKMYIRHRNREIVFENFDGSDMFKQNATFSIKQPNWDGNNRLSPKRIGEKSFSSSREASFAAFIFYIFLVITTGVIVVINQGNKKGITRLHPKTR